MTLELDVQRRLTKAFIATAPEQVVLRPRVKGETSTGGTVWQQGVPRPVQTMRLVEPSTVNVLAPAPQLTTDGQVRKVAFLLLGEWDAVMGQYDTFTLHGHEWEVVQLAHFNGWEQRASVARYG